MNVIFADRIVFVRILIAQVVVILMDGVSPGKNVIFPDMIVLVWVISIGAIAIFQPLRYATRIHIFEDVSL